ncbi:MAG: ABC transporter ATP-binding protein, partial [Planctomycetes bacterium]|nr:ABC transporter ATP-binding protein [Planctomycetota bacterium]
MNLLWRVTREQLSRYWKGLVIRTLVASAVAATPYVFSMLGKWLVDDVLQVGGPPAAAAAWMPRSEDEKLGLLMVFFAVTLAIHVAITAASGASELINAHINEGMAFRLRSAVHEKLSSLEMGLFSREQVGQLMTRTMEETGLVPASMTNLAVNLFTQAAMLVLGVVLLVGLNGRMALVVLATLPFYAVSCAIFLPRLRRVTLDQRDRWAAMGGYAMERITNIVTVRNYAQESREISVFDNWVDQNLSLVRRQHRLNLYFGTLTTVITGVGTLAVLWMGFLGIRAGRMQIGEVLAFYAVAAQLFVPVSALVGLGTVTQMVEVYARRMYDILDLPDHLQDAPDALDLPEPVRGA